VRGLAVAALALILLQAATAALFHGLSSDVPIPPNMFGIRGYMAAFAVVLGCAGALIAQRRPNNAIGWICIGAGLLAGIQGVAEGYAFWAYLGRERPSGLGLWAAWIAEWVWLLFLGGIALVTALFPDGRWRSKGWRNVMVVSCTGTVLATLANAVAPKLVGFPADNPIGLPVDPSIYLPVTGAFTWAFGLVMIVGGAACALARFRDSRGVERQQLKWLALAAWMIAAATTIYGLITVLTGSLGVNPKGYEWAGLLIVASILALPVSIAIAILNHRLYDIDVIINRTLVYGAVTTVLGACYVGGVLGLQALLPSPTRSSSLAVALTTLGTLAVFRPLRIRIQALVDRRFYRSKYDAEKVIERFGVHLRHETDLATIQKELLAVVEATMQPVHASLWLRSANGPGA
jgi:hypothetical protein